MKLFYLSASPFVRKVIVVAEELGISGRIEKLACAPGPVTRDMNVVARNPLGKVPTLLTDEGDALFDSRVISEYLDTTFGNGQLFPVDPAARWRALREQAIADGLLDAAILVRYESALRPEELRWDAWKGGQLEKVAASLAAIEADIDDNADRVDIGAISTACALGYLDFRFADLRWRDSHPRSARWFRAFSQRPSMRLSDP